MGDISNFKEEEHLRVVEFVLGLPKTTSNPGRSQRIFAAFIIEAAYARELHPMVKNLSDLATSRNNAIGEETKPDPKAFRLHLIQIAKTRNEISDLQVQVEYYRQIYSKTFEPVSNQLKIIFTDTTKVVDRTKLLLQSLPQASTPLSEATVKEECRIRLKEIHGRFSKICEALDALKDRVGKIMSDAMDDARKHFSEERERKD